MFIVSSLLFFVFVVAGREASHGVGVMEKKKAVYVGKDLFFLCGSFALTQERVSNVRYLAYGDESV